MTKHADATNAHLHPAAYPVANAAARIALAATLVTGQIGFLVYQVDTDVMYKCSAAATLTTWTPTLHASSHENAGSDEISVLGLSGLLADGQTPLDHLHAGVAGDGEQLEADTALLGTGDSAGDLLAAVGDNSVEWLAPGTGLYVWFDITYAAEGAVEVATGALRFYAPIALTIDKVYIAVNTAPTDASLIVDVHKGGVTIFTDQGKRPTIVTTEFVDESDTPDITALAKNDYVTIDIDQVGSSVAGSDLTVHIRCKQFLQIA